MSSPLYLLLPLLLLHQVVSTSWTVPVSIQATSNWDSGMILVLKIANPSFSEVARALLITIKVCYGELVDHWTSLPSGSSSLLRISPQDSSSPTYLLMASSLYLAPDSSTTFGVSLVKSSPLFRFDTSFLVGAELYDAPFHGNMLPPAEFAGIAKAIDYYPPLSLLPPIPLCGDGFCGQEETVSSCPVDCVLNQCVVVEQTVNTWTGQVSLTPDPSNANWYGCYGISIKNTGTLTATSFILTIKLCPAHATINDLSGYQQAQIGNSVNPNLKFYQSISNDIIYLPYQTYSAARICFDFPAGEGLLASAVQFGVELRDQQTGCLAGNCQPSCGDGVCGIGEDCPVDCVKMSC
jgi:hypothetical protein